MTTKTMTLVETLQKSREHINTMWVRGAWFASVNPEDTTETDQDGSVSDGWQVTGVCAAGSVLYALDYTHEQWTKNEDVQPVIEALFAALPANSAPVRKYRENVASGYDGGYDARLEAIIDYNDAPRRRKTDVLALFDRAIDAAFREQTLDIPELP